VYVGKSRYPVVSMHSIPILKKDAFTVDFYSEFGIGKFMLKPNLRQKVYF